METGFSNSFTDYFVFLKVALPAAMFVGTFLLLTQLARRRKVIDRGDWSIVATLAQSETLQEKIETLLAAAGMDEVLDAGRFYQVVIFIFLLASMPFVLKGTFAGVIFAALAAAAVPVGGLLYMRSRRQALIEDQLIAFFNEMAARMKAHEDPQSAFRDSIGNTEPPLRHILERVERNIRQMKDFPTALVKSRDYVTSPYYQDFIDAVQISYVTSGKLSDIVEGVIEQINERKIAIQKLKAAMAAINLQMVVIFIAPPLLTWMMIIQNPQAGEILFSTLAGFVILGVTLVLYVIAIAFAFWIRSSVTKKIS